MSSEKTYRSLRVSENQNELPVAEYFDTYLKLNPAIGYLTFDVYENSPIRGRMPIPDALITISKLLGNNYFISQIVKTGPNGQTEPVPLPAVSKERSLTPEEESRAFTTYYASIEAPGYQRRRLYDVQIFDGITSIQKVEMKPEASISTLSSVVTGVTGE